MNGSSSQGSDVRSAHTHGGDAGISKSQESSLPIQKCCQDKWLQECKEIKDLLQKILQVVLEDSDSSDSDTEIQKSDLKKIQEQGSKCSTLQGQPGSGLYPTGGREDISKHGPTVSWDANARSDWRRNRFEGYKHSIRQPDRKSGV